MTIHPAIGNAAARIAADTSASNQPSSQGFQPQQITTTDFMTLLAAQLKGQDPTNPVDPTTFVTQLAQFVELSQVSNIDTMLQNYLQPSNGATATGAAPSPAAGSK